MASMTTVMRMTRMSKPRSLMAAQCTLLRSFASSSTAIPTALYKIHEEELGGSMVDFAGYSLPVQYKDAGVLAEHSHCRSAAALFDVSHMGQIRWYGTNVTQFLERMVVGNLAELEEGQACLSLVTNEKGGILDDTVITKTGPHEYYMVVNGATKHDDMEHFLKYKPDDVTMEYWGDDMQLLALQGPKAASVVQKVLLPADFDLPRMPFMSGTDVTLGGIDDCRLTRCGYTGEDGFEIAVPTDSAESLARLLLDQADVKPAGLGARDSLRLEAGLCLYGHDLNENINPVEGSLGWTMGPPGSRRRTEQGFLGAEHVLTPEGKLRKVPHKRVGFVGMKAPAREGVEIYDGEDDSMMIGQITSGTFSPSLKKPIAMGYVSKPYSKVGTTVQLKIRGKMQTAEVASMPFVEARYHKIEE